MWYSMAVFLPAVAKLKLLSTHSGISGYTESDHVIPHVNLAQLEVLLRTSKVLGWQWSAQRRELQVLLQSCVRIVISCGEALLGEILDYRVDHSFVACAKKKTAVACALSQELVVVSFASTELLTFAVVSSTEDERGPQTYCQKKILSSAEDFDSHLLLNSESNLLLYCLTPRSTISAKRWRPKNPEKLEWMLFVFASSAFRSNPLQRLHKLRGREGQRVLHMTFPVAGLNIFALFTYQGYPDSLQIHRYVIEKHALRLISSNAFTLPGAIVSLTIQPKTGWATLGLDNLSLVQISTWNNQTAWEGKCNVKPQMLKWSADGMLLCVANSEGFVELYDAALQNVPAVLMNELCDTESGIRLRTCFKGPLASLCFAASEGSREAQLLQLVRYYTVSHKLSECLSCLEASRNHCSVEELKQASQLGFTYIIQQIGNLDDTTTGHLNLVERLLQLLKQSDSQQPRTVTEAAALQPYYSLLMRRYFSCLIRVGAFDRALKLAGQTKDYGFHQILLKNVFRIHDEQLKIQVENTATKLLGDKSNSSTLTNTTMVPLFSTSDDKFFTANRKHNEDELSWKDMGEI